MTAVCGFEVTGFVFTAHKGPLSLAAHQLTAE
jgi:hypothetical protein